MPGTSTAMNAEEILPWPRQRPLQAGAHRRQPRDAPLPSYSRPWPPPSSPVLSARSLAYSRPPWREPGHTRQTTDFAIPTASSTCSEAPRHAPSIQPACGRVDQAPRHKRAGSSPISDLASDGVAVGLGSSTLSTKGFTLKESSTRFSDEEGRDGTLAFNAPASGGWPCPPCRLARGRNSYLLLNDTVPVHTTPLEYYI
jgi:hypothetical protein